MRRREVMAVLGSAVARTWSSAAFAQQPRLLVVGFLGQSTPSAEAERIAAFSQRLHELGWREGRTISMEYRWAEGRSERAAEIAAEFVRLKVDVIVPSGTPQVIAAKQVTTTIPIVFVPAGDPVRSGLVASLARPGGNVTGLTSLAADLAGKRLQLLSEAVPSLRRLAIMGNAENPLIVMELGELRTTGLALGLEVITSEIRRTEDIAPAIEALRGGADALYVCLDLVTVTNRIHINTLALRAGLPVMHADRENVQPGALMSYGPNYLHLFRRAGDLVDKVLRGAKPADLPVEQPIKFDLVINLKAAKARRPGTCAAAPRPRRRGDRVRRNPRRAYDADGREIEPMPLSNIREHGVRSVEATCEDRKQDAVVNVNSLPDDLYVPDVALRLRCSAEDVTAGQGHSAASPFRRGWTLMWKDRTRASLSSSGGQSLGARLAKATSPNAGAPPHVGHDHGPSSSSPSTRSSRSSRSVARTAAKRAGPGSATEAAPS